MGPGAVSGGQIPRRVTFGGRRSAVTFESLTAEINKVVDNKQYRTTEKRIKAIKTLIQEYVDVKGTENKPKLHKTIKCCMKLKDRQDLVGKAAKSFGLEMIQGFNDERKGIINCVKDNLINLTNYNTNAKEQTKLSSAKILLYDPKNKKCNTLTPEKKKEIKAGLDKKITDLKANATSIKKQMNSIQRDVAIKVKDFQNKYGVPHDNKIDLPNFE